MSTTEERAKEYFNKKTLLDFVSGVFFLAGLTMPFLFLRDNFFFAVALCISFETLILIVSFVLSLRLERAYRGVTFTFSWGEGIGILLSPLIVLLPFGVIMVISSLIASATGLMAFVYANTAVIFFLYISLLVPWMIRINLNGEKLVNSILQESISTLTRKMGVQLKEVYVLRGKNFKSANAMQVGRRDFSIYISDYLLDNLKIEEIEAVLAHEIAHAKKKHILKLWIPMFSLFVVIMNLFALSFVVGGEQLQKARILSIVLLLFFNVILRGPISRHFELEADAIAADVVGTEYTISALQKIAELNLIPKKLSYAYEFICKSSVHGKCTITPENRHFQ